MPAIAAATSNKSAIFFHIAKFQYILAYLSLKVKFLAQKSLYLYRSTTFSLPYSFDRACIGEMYFSFCYTRDIQKKSEL